MQKNHPLLAPLWNSNPTNIAFQNIDNEQLTYRDLLQKSHHLAAVLQAKGFQKGDKVVLALPSSNHFLIVFYALVYAGGVISLIDPHIGQAQYVAMFQQFHPKWLFLDYKLLFIHEHPLILQYLKWKKKDIPYFQHFKGVHLVATGRWLPVFRRHFNLEKCLQQDIVADFSQQFLSTQEPFLITYTSGTLSQPKGVIHCIDALTKSLKHLENCIKGAEKPRIATNLPQYLLLGVSSGIPVFYWEDTLSGQEKLHFLEKNNITTLFGPPSEFMELILHCKQENIQLPTAIQCILLGSAPVTPSFLQNLISICNEKVKITCLYGMTENLLVASIDGRVKANYQSSEQGDIVGHLFEGIYIEFDENEEVFIHSDQLFLHYWHLQHRETPHATGDLGFLNEKRELVLKGRKKDMIIRRHQNIYPALYEPTILKNPKIKDVAMVGIFDEKNQDEKVFLVIEPAPNHVLTEQAILQQLTYGNFAIAKEALPDKILFRTIPTCGRQQKTDKKALKAWIIAENCK